MKKLLLLCSFLILFISEGYAQSRIITGTVLDNSSKPLDGATIVVVESQKSTFSDATGKFSIAAENGQSLRFSYVGTKPIIITIAADTKVLNVVFKDAEHALNEVVVTGYTSERKKDLTGSVSVVDLAPVKNNSSGNTMQALQGRVAGLYIEKSGSVNGATSRILIRGANTLGNNNPLYIIDGIPTTRPEVFQNLSPSNISSVQVLKDASAESIYGSRASNGVIIVTTKNGGNTQDKVEFQFNNSTSVESEKSSRFKMLNAVDRGKALWRASLKDG